MAGVFISYRRDDSAPWAGRVYERLAQDFRRDQILMDVDSIAPGLDFRRELERHVGQCDAVVAVIGKGWTEARDAQGQRRLDDTKDFVRIELEAALARDIRVIPVLVDGARMPTERELPEALQALAYRNAVTLTHDRFGSDVQKLVGALRPSSIKSPAKPSASASLASSGSRHLVGAVLVGLAAVGSAAIGAVAWGDTVSGKEPRAMPWAVGLSFLAVWLSFACYRLWRR